MTLKSSDLFTFVKLVAKLFKSSEPPAICFHPNGNSLKLCAFGRDAILTMQVDRGGSCDAFAMRLDDLKSLAGTKTGELSFDLQKNAVQIRSGEVLHRFLTGKTVNALPHQPANTSTFPKERLLNALTNAMLCVDKDTAKSNLTGICLRGATSQIVSTSGVQLLVQDGFDFDTWGESDVICPVSKIFTSKEVREIDADDIAVGLVSGHVYFSLGNVEFYLKAIDGRFPKVSQLLEPAEGTTYLNVHPTDVQFILDRIDKLPGGTSNESPVYLSLDVAQWIRAYDTEQKTGVTLELSRSKYAGQPVSVSLNRQFLKNALQFACWKIGIDPTGDRALIFKGDDKTFVCMPLTGKEPEAESMEVIASATQPAVSPVASKVAAPTPALAPTPVKRRRRTVKRDVVTPTAGKATLLLTAEKIRTDLRNSLLQVNSLIREVKAQRQKDRLLQNTMDNLRKLSL